MNINNFSIKYETTDKSLNYEIVIKQGYPKSFNCYGKTWAKKTEAILYLNGFIVSTNSVTKHNYDKDDLKYAVINAIRPLITKISIKYIRKDIWNLIFKHVELCQKEK